MAGGKNIAIINVGGTGTGKSTETRKLIELFDPEYLYVYDVNNEYNDLYKKPFCGVNEFLVLLENVTDALIVFEEATMFFSNKSSSEKLLGMLVQKRHKRNNFIFNFHSLRSIPRYIFDFVDFINIKKTNDTYKIAREKIDDEVFLHLFESVNESNNPYESVVYSTK